MESSSAKASHELDVNKMTEKFMMELAAPASKHSATGCNQVVCFVVMSAADCCNCVAQVTVPDAQNVHTLYTAVCLFICLHMSVCADVVSQPCLCRDTITAGLVWEHLRRCNTKL